MAISVSSIRRSGDDPRRPPILEVYGTHGIGKTSLALGAPSPVFIQVEDGFGELDFPTFGVLTSFQDTLDAIASLINDKHDFRTLFVDSIDWLQPLIYDHVCAEQGWSNIEHPGYGKGYKMALDTWRLLVGGIRHLRDNRGMGIVLLSHSEIHRVNPPDGVAFDRYQPKIDKSASEILQEAADGVLFMKQPVTMVKDNDKDKNSRTRAAGGNHRVIYTTELPTHLGKNRWQLTHPPMPESIRMPDKPEAMWNAIAQHIPYYNQNKKEA